MSLFLLSFFLLLLLLLGALRLPKISRLSLEGESGHTDPREKTVLNLTSTLSVQQVAVDLSAAVVASCASRDRVSCFECSKQTTSLCARLYLRRQQTACPHARLCAARWERINFPLTA